MCFRQSHILFLRLPGPGSFFLESRHVSNTKSPPLYGRHRQFWEHWVLSPLPSPTTTTLPASHTQRFKFNLTVFHHYVTHTHTHSLTLAHNNSVCVSLCERTVRVAVVSAVHPRLGPRAGAQLNASRRLSCRYVGDMLAWLHQATASEKEHLEALLKNVNQHGTSLPAAPVAQSHTVPSTPCFARLRGSQIYTPISWRSTVLFFFKFHDAASLRLEPRMKRTDPPKLGWVTCNWISHRLACGVLIWRGGPVGNPSPDKITGSSGELGPV